MTIGGGASENVATFPIVGGFGGVTQKAYTQTIVPLYDQIGNLFILLNSRPFEKVQ